MFKKATRHAARLRMALVGPAGTGKTFTALKVASYLGGKVAVIDTERGSASKYAPAVGEAADPEKGLFEFDAVEPDNFSPQEYVKAIKAAEQAGYDVLVIDSLSHAWIGRGGALEMHDTAVDRQKTKNTYTAWRDVTPHHNALVEAIVQSRCHVIATMRAKTDYVQEKDEKTGRTVVRKVGLAPVQRDGLEYEFDVVGDLDTDNTFIVTKTRCSVLTGAALRKPGKDLANTLRSWLGTGTTAPVERAITTADLLLGGMTRDQHDRMLAAYEAVGGDPAKLCEKYGVPTTEEIPVGKLDGIMKTIRKREQENAAAANVG